MLGRFVLPIPPSHETGRQPVHVSGPWGIRPARPWALWHLLPKAKPHFLLLRERLRLADRQLRRHVGSLVLALALLEFQVERSMVRGLRLAVASNRRSSPRLSASEARGRVSLRPRLKPSGSE